MFEANDPQTSPEATPLPAPAPRCRILVIDDSSFVRKLLKTSLASLECEVTTAADGLAGLELALHGIFDIVIVDNPLPVMNGLDVCRRLAELPPGRRVVAYCRGPYCVLAAEAVKQLRKRGVEARRLKEGYPEWRDANLPVQTGSESSPRSKEQRR